MATTSASLKSAKEQPVKSTTRLESGPPADVRPVSSTISIDPPHERKKPSPSTRSIDSPTKGEDSRQTEEKSTEPASGGSESNPSNKQDVMDMETFQQILDLDEDDTRDFSSEMVKAYYEQAQSTFEKMDKALEDKDPAELSSLGHFLKGSSAALGVRKVQKSCEEIQNYGRLPGKDKNKNLDEVLLLIKDKIAHVKAEYAQAEVWLKEYYNSEPVSPVA